MADPAHPPQARDESGEVSNDWPHLSQLTPASIQLPHSAGPIAADGQEYDLTPMRPLQLSASAAAQAPAPAPMPTDHDIGDQSESTAGTDASKPKRKRSKRGRGGGCRPCVCEGGVNCLREHAACGDVSLPRNHEKARLWLRILNPKGITEEKFQLWLKRGRANNARVSKVHFSLDMLQRNAAGHVMVRRGAVPTLQVQWNDPKSLEMLAARMPAHTCICNNDMSTCGNVRTVGWARLPHEESRRAVWLRILLPDAAARKTFEQHYNRTKHMGCVSHKHFHPSQFKRNGGKKLLNNKMLPRLQPWSDEEQSQPLSSEQLALYTLSPDNRAQAVTLGNDVLTAAPQTEMVQLQTSYDGHNPADQAAMMQMHHQMQSQHAHHLNMALAPPVMHGHSDMLMSSSGQAHPSDIPNPSSNGNHHTQASNVFGTTPDSYPPTQIDMPPEGNNVTVSDAPIAHTSVAGLPPPGHDLQEQAAQQETPPSMSATVPVATPEHPHPMQGQEVTPADGPEPPPEQSLRQPAASMAMTHPMEHQQQHHQQLDQVASQAPHMIMPEHHQAAIPGTPMMHNGNHAVMHTSSLNDGNAYDPNQHIMYHSTSHPGYAMMTSGSFVPTSMMPHSDQGQMLYYSDINGPEPPHEQPQHHHMALGVPMNQDAVGHGVSMMSQPPGAQPVQYLSFLPSVVDPALPHLSHKRGPIIHPASNASGEPTAKRLHREGDADASAPPPGQPFDPPPASQTLYLFSGQDGSIGGISGAQRKHDADEPRQLVPLPDQAPHETLTVTSSSS
eukprot:TRINITY_DN10097_c0_g1_i1.p1 TRINITY_DN10097_c0_g1~~TRINITY_DN10097_c0_g1_i1.p1  ORF type:complete len:783 (+),score=138.92 TRINITY_DN10097_c0_g1_i1:110-2458(+)